MNKRETPIKRPSCFYCGRGIEEYEDYIIYGGTGALGKEFKTGSVDLEFNFHTECLKENVEEAAFLGRAITPRNQKSILVKLEEGKYIFLEWVGKTWSFRREYHRTLTVEDVKKFLSEIPKNLIREWRKGG